MRLLCLLLFLKWGMSFQSTKQLWWKVIKSWWDISVVFTICFCCPQLGAAFNAGFKIKALFFFPQDVECVCVCVCLTDRQAERDLLLVLGAAEMCETAAHRCSVSFPWSVWERKRKQRDVQNTVIKMKNEFKWLIKIRPSYLHFWLFLLIWWIWRGWCLYSSFY